MEARLKAKELIDKIYNTEHCGINHFPNKNYCDCSEMNMFQAKQCALIAVDEMISQMLCLMKVFNEDRSEFEAIELDYLTKVKQELELL